MMYMFRGFVRLRERGGFLFTCVAFTAACTCEVYVNLCTVNETAARHNHICFLFCFFSVFISAETLRRACTRGHSGSQVVRNQVLYSPNKSVFFSTQGSCFRYCFFKLRFLNYLPTESRDFSLYRVPPSVFILRIYFIFLAYHLSV